MTNLMVVRVQLAQKFALVCLFFLSVYHSNCQMKNCATGEKQNQHHHLVNKCRRDTLTINQGQKLLLDTPHLPMNRLLSPRHKQER